MENLSVQDRLDIADVLARYCVALDSRDWNLLERVFTPDAVAAYGRVGDPRGLPAIVGVVRASLEPLDASQHFIGTSLVEPDGEGGARGRTYLIAQHVRNQTPGGDQYVIAGTYVDRFVRTPGGWRISERRLVHTWTRGNPAVLS
ncbi:nuclear transport factor 2 family protein [Thermobifida halotolerans]|uniref:Nuclear transport factor 2 family protein n=1 Tax=Thermobifida halotolerans TaxID=483545 RepID=A0AA97M0G5_9ACTN|nr:nuclear transport factor 2 family protein [Thermobifida halotolerans]UOE21208.1 nuclear transport factor 2 family protein [Thermobifida halotolerans]